MVFVRVLTLPYHSAGPKIPNALAFGILTSYLFTIHSSLVHAFEICIKKLTVQRVKMTVKSFSDILLLTDCSFRCIFLLVPVVGSVVPWTYRSTRLSSPAGTFFVSITNFSPLWNSTFTAAFRYTDLISSCVSRISLLYKSKCFNEKFYATKPPGNTAGRLAWILIRTSEILSRSAHSAHSALRWSQSVRG